MVFQDFFGGLRRLRILGCPRRASREAPGARASKMADLRSKLIINRATAEGYKFSGFRWSRFSVLEIGFAEMSF